MGNDVSGNATAKDSSDFNPRSRVGNDVTVDSGSAVTSDFNPRSRVGNDERTKYPVMGRTAFQSTFPRGERPNMVFMRVSRYKISIHVPAWGTTWA